MRNNETGEFELVVGNRQIMSGFFIVVLLFAVGVAMGYFLGQNSPRSAKLAEPSAGAPAQGDPRPQPTSAAQPPQQATPPATAQEQPAAERPAEHVTQPVREPVPVSAPIAESAAASSPAPEAPAGTYWQVMAVNRADADIVVRTLKNKGFPATVSPGAKGLTRVLVGPFGERGALGRAKSDLESAGFSSFYKVEISGDRK